MPYFYSIVSIFCLIPICSSLKYYLPKDLCNSSLDFSGISVGAENELVLFVDNSVWYWPGSNAQSQGNWTTGSLPWNWTTFNTGFVVIRRNFRENDTECVDHFSDFFVIRFNPTTGDHEYDIYKSPGWYYSSKRASPPLLRDHYLFGLLFNHKNKSINRLTAAFSWNDLVVLFQGSNYYTLRLNQTICDTKISLSSTVSLLYGATNQLPIEPISSFYDSKDIYFFTKSQTDYKYQTYERANISESGEIRGENGVPATKQMFGEFFNCENLPTLTTPYTQNSLNESIPSERTDYESETSTLTGDIQTEETPRKTRMTPSPTEMSHPNFLKILIVILLISVIASVIICIICCFCNQISKSKAETQDFDIEKDGKTVSPIAVLKSKSKETATSEQFANRELKQTNQLTDNLENKQNHQKPMNDINKEIKLNKLIDESPEGATDKEDPFPDSPRKKKSPKPQELDINYEPFIAFVKGGNAPDEGKPQNPFEGFP